MTKSAFFGVMHLGIALGMSCALTGSVDIAGALTVEGQGKAGEPT